MSKEVPQVNTSSKSAVVYSDPEDDELPDDFDLKGFLPSDSPPFSLANEGFKLQHQVSPEGDESNVDNQTVDKLTEMFLKMCPDEKLETTSGSVGDILKDQMSKLEDTLNENPRGTDKLSDMMRIMDNVLKGNASADDIANNLEDVFGNLLSGLMCKDVIYEPVLELKRKYTTWLNDPDNFPSSKPATERPSYESKWAIYKQQFSLICRMVDELENKTRPKQEGIDSKQTETLMSIIEELQSLGDLPELAGSQDEAGCEGHSFLNYPDLAKMDDPTQLLKNCQQQ